MLVTKVKNRALCFVEPHTAGLGCPDPLQSRLTLWQINTLFPFGVICKLAEGALDPLVQVINNDIKQNWLQP